MPRKEHQVRLWDGFPEEVVFELEPKGKSEFAWQKTEKGVVGRGMVCSLDT